MVTDIEPLAEAKLGIGKRLGSDWMDLAAVLGIPTHLVSRFERGAEGYAIWDYLKVRNELRTLPNALRHVGRSDLADLIEEALHGEPSWSTSPDAMMHLLVDSRNVAPDQISIPPVPAADSAPRNATSTPPETPSGATNRGISGIMVRYPAIVAAIVVGIVATSVVAVFVKLSPTANAGNSGRVEAEPLGAPGGSSFPVLTASVTPSTARSAIVVTRPPSSVSASAWGKIRNPSDEANVSHCIAVGGEATPVSGTVADWLVVVVPNGAHHLINQIDVVGGQWVLPNVSIGGDETGEKNRYHLYLVQTSGAVTDEFKEHRTAGNQVLTGDLFNKAQRLDDIEVWRTTLAGC
jgi:hypothetical protein